MKGFWLDGVSNAITLLANVIGTTIIYIFISQFDDSTLQASYGLSMSYFFFIFIALTDSSYEITSLTISKSYGSRKYAFLTTYLVQGFTLQLIILTFALIMFVFSYQI